MAVKLVELVKPDPGKPARLLRDPETNTVVLEYIGIDGNAYRVPILLIALPQEFADLRTQLTLTDLIEMIRARIATSDIMVPVDVQSAYVQVPVDLQGDYIGLSTRLEGIGKHYYVTVLSSTTLTADWSSSDLAIDYGRTLNFIVDVTAVGGTSPTLTIYIDYRDPTSGKYITQDQFSTISAVGTYTKSVPVLSTIYRVRAVLGGTSPSFTLTISMIVLK